MNALQYTSLALVVLVALLAYSSWDTSGRRHRGARDWGYGFLVFGLAMVCALARLFVEDHRTLSALSGCLIVLGAWFHYRGFATILGVSSRRRIVTFLVVSLTFEGLAGLALVAFETREVSRILENTFNSLYLFLMISSVVTTKVRLPSGQRALIAVLLGALLPLYAVSTLGSLAELVGLRDLGVWANPFDMIGPTEWVVALAVLATCENLLLVALVAQDHTASLDEAQGAGQRLRRANEALEGFQSAMLQTMSRFLEGDAEGDPTLVRTAALTESILGNLGYSNDYARLVGLASILHGVTRHPAGAAAPLAEPTLEGLPFYQLASRIALDLREHWDGTGQPLGKRGSEIGLEARVVAVASFYQASSATPDELQSRSGTIYDPEVVKACLDAAAPSLRGLRP